MQDVLGAGLQEGHDRCCGRLPHRQGAQVGALGHIKGQHTASAGAKGCIGHNHLAIEEVHSVGHHKTHGVVNSFTDVGP